jgi:hypothetical protein
MTLICRFSIRNAPVVVGDVLLSSGRKTGLQTNLPLVGDINRLLAAEGLPFEVSLTQKVNILSDRLVVAWGGGFEAVTFRLDSGGGSGRLQKVGDILHTFWKVDLSSADQSRFIPSFYKTTYWQDALIVRYARFDSADARTFHLAMNSFELIPPLLKDAKDYDLDEIGEVDFSYKVLCCHVSVERPNGLGVMHFAQPSKPGETIELEVAKDSSGRIHIPGELSKRVIEEARRRASQIVGDTN